MASNPAKSGCCNVLTLHEGSSKGSVKEVVNYRTYVAGQLTKGGKVLVIFTDIYGLDLVNVQLLADAFHESLGYTVVIPDILKNDAYPTEEIKDNDTAAAKFNAWLGEHPLEECKTITQTFLKEFKKEYNPVFTAGIGYCWGAKFIIQNMTKGGDFDVGAAAHPSFVAEEEVEKIAVPFIISAAQTDTIFTPELRRKTEEILSKNNISYQIDLFSGTSHGFAVRGDRSVPDVKYAADKALTDQVTWFARFDKDASTGCSC